MLKVFNGTSNDKKVPVLLVILTLVICLFPFFLNQAGLDFSSSPHPLEGAFTHIIVEWSVFFLVIFTAIFGLVHYKTTKNIEIAVIALALLMAGSMDSLHALSSVKSVSNVSDGGIFILFSWVGCRTFHVAIMFIGVSVFLFSGEQKKKYSTLKLLAILTAIFSGMFFIVTSDLLMTRAYDLLPLTLFLFAGLFLYPAFLKKYPSHLAYALILSAIINVAVELNMIFGSTRFFDNHFNIAHILKVLAYALPFFGLILDHMNHYKSEQKDKIKLVASVKKLEESKGSNLELLTHISQELRGPLNSIVLLSSTLIKNESIDSNTLKSLGDINDGGNNLLYLLDDLVSLVNIAPEKLVFSKEQRDVSAVLDASKQEAQTTVQDELSEYRDSIEEELPAGLGVTNINEPKRSTVRLRTRKCYSTLNFEDDQKNITALDKVLLIIEDDDSFAKILMKLAHKKDFKCVISNFGEDALALMKRFHPVALLLDLGLPGMQGCDVITELRGDETGKYLPFLVISAEPTMFDREKEPPMAILEKPISIDKIKEVAESLGQINKPKYPSRVLLIGKSSRSEYMPLKIDAQVDCSQNEIEIQNFLSINYYHCIVFDNTKEEGVTLEKLIECCKSALNEAPLMVFDEALLTATDRALLKEHGSRVPIFTAADNQKINNDISGFLSKLDDLNRLEKEPSLCRTFLKNKKVLMIDDNPSNIFVLKKLLSSYGVICVTAERAQEGLDILFSQSTDIDMVLMDIMMPEMDGMEATRIIREKEGFKCFPIIAVTAKVMPQDRIDCLNSGANDYVMKPIDPQKLIQTMIRHL